MTPYRNLLMYGIELGNQAMINNAIDRINEMTALADDWDWDWEYMTSDKPWLVPIIL